MAYPCPATQNAIDRIASEFKDRAHFLEVMTRPSFTASDFVSYVLSVWKDSDLKLATGRGREWWIAAADRIEGR